MNDIKYNDIPCFRIAVMGSAGVGKTAIVNRLVNNYFPLIYEPTMDIEKYTALFNLNDDDVKTKTFVMVTLEDMFGINNPLLSTPVSLINSSVLKEKRELMSENFKKIMFTSMEKRNKLSTEQKKPKNNNNQKSNPRYAVYEQIFNDDPKVERLGFILVCDCTDPKSVDDLKQIIDKLHQIEKTNNLFYPKCIMVNKVDKMTEKEGKGKLKSMMTELEQLKSKYKLDCNKVSALTNQEVLESFRKFISKIHQQQVDNKQNEGVEDQEDALVDDYQPNCGDKFTSISKKMFCGRSIFSCGVYL
jgi:GTPase SAR1 family protein